jgi:DNA-binding transcriptional MerR regulator
VDKNHYEKWVVGLRVRDFLNRQETRERIVLKIGEFARIAQISIATLRYYDQSNLLKPLALDPETGYRYYSLDQLPRLNRILALKELGFPLEQIAQLLEEGLSFEQLRGMFKLKQAQTQQIIAAEQARLMRIAARLRQIEQEGKMPTHEVLLKQVDALLVASFRGIVPLDSGLGQVYGRVYGKIMAYLDQQRVQPEAPALLLLYSRSEQRSDGLYIDMEVAIPLPTALPGNEQITIRTLPGALVASTIHTGYDLYLGQAHLALNGWIKDNGYQIVAPPRHVLLRHEEHMEPAQYVTEVQFLVEKCH